MDTSIIVALMGVVSSLAGFLFGRRKRHAEEIGQELSNMQQAIQVWKEVAEYQSGEIAALRTEINHVKKELSDVERMYRKRFLLQCQNFNNQPVSTNKKCSS
jgi:LPXTG-motif cell wall-anchored protein